MCSVMPSVMWQACSQISVLVSVTVCRLSALALLHFIYACAACMLVNVLILSGGP